jgi:hypothetical protein
MKTSQVVLSVVGALVLLLGLTWLLQGNDFFLYKTFAPKYEQTRREVFKQTPSFVDGMVQELQNMQFEYAKATPEQKDALASIILHRAATFDLNQPQVPADLRQFIEQLRRERATAR